MTLALEQRWLAMLCVRSRKSWKTDRREKAESLSQDDLVCYTRFRTTERQDEFVLLIRVRQYKS